MPRTIALKAPLDESGLWRKAPDAPSPAVLDTAALPRQGAPDMPVDHALGRTVTVPADEVREAFARLAPHLPAYLLKVEPSPSGFGLRFQLAAFTGREKCPAMPSSYYDDPALRVVGKDDPREFRIRQMADQVMSELLQEACREWRDASYVADLKQAVADTPDRWKTYEREAKALESAYAYLRTPEAAREWPAAISRLVDAQDRTRTAAARFDDRAAEIARVHEKHLYADLGHTEALTRAGFPEAAHWHIASADSYSSSYFSSWSSDVPLTEQARRLIEQQDTHVTKVGRLSGTATT
ncbi:hypothetical protein ACIGDI_39790 [Streptomyces sp. NPDC085900]|uniref:hypothetical protein n=1 Tax=Streptomyces sp. NPDC085900 TaxID=3365737 RepID=UPI0037D1F6C2